ncbi:mechanosensitive ion channel domain-containing protein [Halobium salinum]|uniref:Mechanosensitive ion channel domain-containing protein n=1 Tax=Halobium salinum TaxID=1364940 RepID=A0ABD5PES5_9EURY|nr:mechanosensitive ion channel domain-containing protein [Halobium salinum]
MPQSSASSTRRFALQTDTPLGPSGPSTGESGVVGAVLQALDTFVADLLAALPNLVAGAVFLAVAAALVWVVMRVVEFGLVRAFSTESPVYRDFVATVVRLFLWFGVALTFLSVLGLDEIAASLGTATGFVALGVAYATSDMIADAVAGVYLLRDPDFNVGDHVETAKVTGVVTSIELRKTRFEAEGDVVVVGNAAIEDNWRQLTDGSGGAEAGAPPPADSLSADSTPTDSPSADDSTPTDDA